jgi:hypothetical protein
MFVAQPYGMTLNLFGVDELSPHEGIGYCAFLRGVMIRIRAAKGPQEKLDIV